MKLAGLVLMWAAVAAAQMAVSGSTTNGRFTGTASFGVPPNPGWPTTGAPYSCEERRQQGAQSTSQKVYRDSEGRMRTEARLQGGGDEMPLVVTITDPVANVQYVLDTRGKVAHRLAIPSGQEVGFTAVPRKALAEATVAIEPRTSSEPLGMQNIDGTAAEGMRVTSVHPDFQTIHETWFAADLKIIVMSKTVDSRNGETSFLTANLVRGPQDAALFVPPADYAIVDETGPFAIEYK